MLYRAPVDTSPVTEGVTLFKHQLLKINIFKTKKGIPKREMPFVFTMKSLSLNQ